MSNDTAILFEIHAFLKREMIHAAYFAIRLNKSGLIEFVELQYTPEYVRHAQSIPLLPTLPVNNKTYVFQCTQGNIPGFIDELLPDSWGQALLDRTLRRANIDRNPQIADYLTVPTGSYLGCFTAVPANSSISKPKLGLHLISADVAGTIRAARRVDRLQGSEEDVRILEAAGGTNPGGARPKFLAWDDTGYWLAKLERHTDKYNLLLAEHTALEIARDAGLSAPVSKITNVEDQRMLLVERFDLDHQLNRVNTFTANSLLKNSATQSDISFGSYEDIAQLIRKYSDQPREDLRQLLGQALLNNALKNTDDHLRNFSFCMDKQGCRLSPAYDIVPRPVIGAYHQLNWELSPYLPKLSSAPLAARHLGLPASDGEQLQASISESIKKHAQKLKLARASTRSESW